MIGIDLLPLIKGFGYIGIFSSILLENSIPLLFFMPGDTLLITAGLLAAQGYLDIELLLIGGFITAITGYMLGYHFGHRIGAKIFQNGDNRFIKTEHLEKTKDFYNKYGSLSVFIARFLPLRACVVFIAGAVSMPYKTFMVYNILSAFCWAILLTLAGYFLGHVLPIDDIKTLAFVPLVGIVLVMSLALGLSFKLKKVRHKV